jgi:MFS family permease
MRLSKFALLFVVFVDVAGQGVIIPIIDTLIMEPGAAFLPPETSPRTRHFDYGLVIGVFYLSWFLGAVYVSKLSDSIGRKNGILLCLAGALVGYVLTIVAIAVGSLWLMLLGRAVTGFTAGNQPIAQAAMADLSVDDADKTRNLGYCVSALSVGLVAGPLIAGVLSDQDLLGALASLSLPFYFSMALVLVAILLIQFFFQDKLATRAPLRVRPTEVFLLLWQVTGNPTVLRLSAAFFFFMFVWNTCYVFIDNYLTSRFAIGAFGASMAILTAGVALVLSSTFLVSYAGQRWTKQSIVLGCALIMALMSLLYVFTPLPVISYLAVVPLAAAFAVGYATLLSLFSASVGEDRQGWVMGITTALWTLGAGLTSLVGGDVMGLDIRLPFYMAAASAGLTIVLIFVLWQISSIRQIALQPPT